MQFLHQLIPVSVGQPDVGNYEVERVLLGRHETGLNRIGRRYGIAAVLQQAGNDLKRVLVIINEQHAKTRGRGRIERRGGGQRLFVASPSSGIKYKRIPPLE